MIGIRFFSDTNQRLFECLLESATITFLTQPGDPYVVVVDAERLSDEIEDQAVQLGGEPVNIISQGATRA